MLFSRNNATQKQQIPVKSISKYFFLSQYFIFVRLYVLVPYVHLKNTQQLEIH